MHDVESVSVGTTMTGRPRPRYKLPVGLMSAFVQGYLLKHMLRRFTPMRIASFGLIGSSLTYLGFGLASEGWSLANEQGRLILRRAKN